MPTYRAYQLTDVKRIAMPPTMFVAGDDNVAIEEAKKLVNGHDVELWEASRLVITLRSKIADRSPR